MRTPVAIHDVGPEGVAERRAERVHQASERPDDEQRHAGQSVDAEGHRGLGHQLPLRIEVEDRPEPHGHVLAVVVALPEHARARQCGHHAETDGSHQEDVHGLVVLGGGCEHRPDCASPVHQQHDAEERGCSGEGTEEHREEVVGPLRDPDPVGPRLRDEQPHHVSHDNGEDAEVEQRTGDPHQFAFVQLTRAGRPTEAVVAVTPDHAHDEDRNRHIRQDVPQQDVSGAHAGLGGVDKWPHLRAPVI